MERTDNLNAVGACRNGTLQLPIVLNEDLQREVTFRLGRSFNLQEPAMSRNIDELVLVLKLTLDDNWHRDLHKQ